MQSVSYPDRFQSALSAQPELQLNSRSEGADIYVVWRGAPKYLAECIEDVAQACNFRIAGITAERRVAFRDDTGTMHARSLRRIRLRFTGSGEMFSSGLVAVLEEIERVCPWLHVARLERSARESRPMAAQPQAYA